MNVTQFDLYLRLCDNHNIPPPVGIVVTDEDYKTFERYGEQYCVFEGLEGSYEISYQGVQILNEAFLESDRTWGEMGWHAALDAQRKLTESEKKRADLLQQLSQTCINTMVTVGDLFDARKMIAQLEHDVELALARNYALQTYSAYYKERFEDEVEDSALFAARAALNE